jgi:hypothetical protein
LGTSVSQRSADIQSILKMRSPGVMSLDLFKSSIVLCRHCCSSWLSCVQGSMKKVNVEPVAAPDVVQEVSKHRYGRTRSRTNSQHLHSTSFREPPRPRGFSTTHFRNFQSNGSSNGGCGIRGNDDQSEYSALWPMLLGSCSSVGWGIVVSFLHLTFMISPGPTNAKCCLDDAFRCHDATDG